VNFVSAVGKMRKHFLTPLLIIILAEVGGQSKRYTGLPIFFSGKVNNQQLADWQ
jgi:hypothetical protein